MKMLFIDYSARLEELHREIEEAIEGLPVAGLDWVPGQGMNSLAVLLVHTARAERYWIGDVIGEDRSGRVRSLEFETSGISAQGLLTILADALEHSKQTLSSLTLADLAEERLSIRDGSHVTVSWSLLHALEHTAVHLGHIQIGRQLWDQHAPG